MVTGYNEFPYVISLSPIMANIIVGKGGVTVIQTFRKGIAL